MIVTVTLPVGVTTPCLPRRRCRWAAGTDSCCTLVVQASGTRSAIAARPRRALTEAATVGGQISAPLSVQQSTGRSCAGLQLFPRLAGAAARGQGATLATRQPLQTCTGKWNGSDCMCVPLLVVPSAWIVRSTVSDGSPPIPAAALSFCASPTGNAATDRGELASARRDAAGPGNLVVHQRPAVEHRLDQWSRRRRADGRDVDLEAAELNLVGIDAAVRRRAGQIVFDQGEDEVGALEVASHDAEVQRSLTLVNGRVDWNGAAVARDLWNLVVQDLELSRHAPAGREDQRPEHCDERERPAKRRRGIHVVAPGVRSCGA